MENCHGRRPKLQDPAVVDRARTVIARRFFFKILSHQIIISQCANACTYIERYNNRKLQKHLEGREDMNVGMKGDTWSLRVTRGDQRHTEEEKNEISRQDDYTKFRQT